MRDNVRMRDWREMKQSALSFGFVVFMQVRSAPVGFSNWTAGAAPHRCWWRRLKFVLNADVG
jgi:hypothetical protein